MTAAAPRPSGARLTLNGLELKLPPLPQTMVKALDLMNLPEGPEVDQVADLIQHDPGVVARLLRVVNSAYYGQKGGIQNVSRAVMILGTASVTGIIIGMGMQEMHRSVEARASVPFFKIVRHSIATAFLARHMLQSEAAQETSLLEKAEQRADLFTGALLHDFGKLLLLYNFPEKAAAFYHSSANDPLSEAELLQREKERLGHDHVEAGVYLAEQMHFPEVLLKAIALHHQDPRKVRADLPVLRLAATIRAANFAASALGYPSHHIVTIEQCCTHPVWDQLVADRMLAYPHKQSLLRTVLASRTHLDSYVDALI